MDGSAHYELQSCRVTDVDGDLTKSLKSGLKSLAAVRTPVTDDGEYGSEGNGDLEPLGVVAAGAGSGQVVILDLFSALEA
mmetsp:Transcript_18795/g.25470  ORF Transcript_18795/g.25470 Transcript_18795/m.25470 type:complete len:80 (+) Transcript_18795:186-425(+)